ncbi:hypothetical protein UlMin_019335 [Ulmus minor]
MASSKDGDPSLGYLTQKDTEVKILRATKVKNKTLPIQITTNLILQEAREHQEKDFNRGHSILGQALEIDYQNHTLWLMYAEVEMKNKFINHARSVWDHAITLLPRVGAWIWFAKFELKNGKVGRARTVYERAVEKKADDEEFEEWCKELERARCIYKFSLEHIPKGMAEDLYRKFVALEKQYGDKEGIEDAIVGKKSPLSYDTWFNYIRLKESMGNTERIWEVFEIAIALKLRRNEILFAKIWLLAAQFEIRQLNLQEVFVVGVGELLCVWCKYVELEKSLLETKRMQSIFELAIAQLVLNMPELCVYVVDTVIPTTLASRRVSFMSLSCLPLLVLGNKIDKQRALSKQDYKLYLDLCLPLFHVLFCRY